MHLFILNTKNSRVGVFYRIAVLKTLAKLKKKHIFNGVVVEKLQVQTCNFTKNRTLQQVLPSGFYIIFQTRLFKEHLQMTAFEMQGNTALKIYLRYHAWLIWNWVLRTYGLINSLLIIYKSLPFYQFDEVHARISFSICLKHIVNLTHFWQTSPFYNPWNHQKTEGFLVLSRAVTWKNWP